MLGNFFYQFYSEQLSLPPQVSIYLSLATNLILVIILGFVLFKSLRYVGSKFLHKIVLKTKTSFDDLLIKNKVFLHITRIVVLIIFLASLKSTLIEFPLSLKYSERVVSVIIIFFSVRFFKSILFTIKDFLREFSSFKDKPIESYIQIFMMVLWMIAIIASFSILTGKSLIRFLTALGAFSAILLLIFKDTILGFVASIQISVNDTVRLNDWITMDKYKADGNIIEINLASVIVKNFDNTITSIPTYSLISDSFKNWRAMNNSGGRRIKRVVMIKVNSVQFIKNEEVDHFKKITLLSTHIEELYNEIHIYNNQHNIDKSLSINGRNLTNLGLFRAYINAYLKQHPKINQDLTVMCRQLAPTPNGVPVEIYAFCMDKEWVKYEQVVSDIFDHILASVSFFNLEVFENPSSTDLSKLKLSN